LLHARLADFIVCFLGSSVCGPSVRSVQGLSVPAVHRAISREFAFCLVRRRASAAVLLEKPHRFGVRLDFTIRFTSGMPQRQHINPGAYSDQEKQDYETIRKAEALEARSDHRGGGGEPLDRTTEPVVHRAVRRSPCCLKVLRQALPGGPSGWSHPAGYFSLAASRSSVDYCDPRAPLFKVFRLRFRDRPLDVS
jgi:hypothetical protein